ncbi:MAG: ABC-type polysaccharide/polyol phosphate export system, permease component [Ilumatobacteraceae bacterium]|nr:ABC-type polysaccharide/polyol phosphate export system, permease component [Ilumatobacteraceae bacterium]
MDRNDITTNITADNSTTTGTITPADPIVGAPITDAASPDATARAAFVALLARDLTVLRKEFKMFLARTVMQPLLLMFVFTYVFPKIGQGVGGGAGAGRFSTLLVGGVIASSMIFQGIQAVALPLVQDFGFTREIEDRVLAPLPVSAIALEKVVAGAVQALIAGLLVFPMGLVIPATAIDLHVNFPLLAAVMVLGAFMSASLGLFVGTRVEPRQVPLIFGLLVIPMTFLGAVYYPWQSLQPLRWLQIAVLINPLVYLSEGMRASLTTGVPHMAWGLVLLILAAVGALLFRVGVAGFRKRVLS